MAATAKISGVPLDLLMRAARSLDRAAMVMIAVVWIVALSIMGLALYTVTVASRVAHQADTIAALEPVMPTMQRSNLQSAYLAKFSERLKKRFHDVAFTASPDNSMNITAGDAGGYTDWLAALSYLDTIAPEIRWNIRDLCIGSECGNTMMRATISGEQVVFKAPDMPTPEFINAAAAPPPPPTAAPAKP